MRDCLRAGALAAALWVIAAPVGAVDRGDLDGLLAYLRTALGPADKCLDLGSAKVDIAWADLNGDGRPEALVYLSGRDWCGSGGCSLIVLERTPAGYRKRGDISISRPPIGVLTTRSHGWRDISVFVRGGGILPGYSAALSFDGTRYAENPSIPPARPLDRTVKVTNLFARTAGKETLPLFPLAAEPAPPTDLPEGVVAVDGGHVEVRVPSAYAQCWTWVNLTPLDRSGPLRYRTGTGRRGADGRLWKIWVFESTGSGDADLEFALIPGWRFIYGAEEQRAAAAKIWHAKVHVP